MSYSTIACCQLVIVTGGRNKSRTKSSPADRPAKEGEAERLRHGGLCVVDHARVTAGNILAKQHLGTQLLHLRRHLARMARMHAIVGAIGGEEDRGIATPALDQLIG